MSSRGTKRKASAQGGRGSKKKKAAPTLRRNVRTGGFLGLEKKFYDKAFNGALVASSDASGGECDPATQNDLSTPAQGDGESNRDGRRFTIMSVQLKGTIIEAENDARTTAPHPAIYYVAVVQDTQSNGAQLNSEDVFVNPLAGANGAPLPFRNLQYVQRFRVLWSTTLVPNQSRTAYGATDTYDVSGRMVTFSMFKKVNIAVTCTGTTAGVASCADNSIHVIAFTNDTDGTPTLRYNSRVRFVG